MWSGLKNLLQCFLFNLFLFSIKIQEFLYLFPMTDSTPVKSTPPLLLGTTPLFVDGCGNSSYLCLWDEYLNKVFA